MYEPHDLAHACGNLVLSKSSTRSATSFFRGTMWGRAVVCKVGPPGSLSVELRTVTALSALPAVRDLVQCYLFAGVVEVGVVAALAFGWSPPEQDHVDLIVMTDFGPTLMDQCRADAATEPLDTVLQARTLRMLLQVFVALDRLRKTGRTQHQDPKLDNIARVDGKILLIDFEFATMADTHNPEAAIDGCGMQPRFEDCMPHFDVHVMLYSLLFFCGRRYRKLPLLETLRATLLGPPPVPHPQFAHLNPHGLSIVYPPTLPPNRTATSFETAIGVTRELLRLV